MDADDLNNFLKNVKISPIQSALDHLHDLSDEDTKILESIRERTERLSLWNTRTLKLNHPLPF